MKDINYEGVERLLHELGLAYDPKTKTFCDDPMYAEHATITSKIEHGAHGIKAAITQTDLIPFLMPQGSGRKED